MKKKGLAAVMALLFLLGASACGQEAVSSEVESGTTNEAEALGADAEMEKESEGKESVKTDSDDENADSIPLNTAEGKTESHKKRIISEEYYNYGELVKYCLYEYDSKGIQKKQEYNQDGIVDGKYTVNEFDSNGNLIKESHYENGEMNYTCVHEYDSNGNKTSSQTEYADGSMRKCVREYGEEGRIYKETTYNADGSVWLYEVYEYDTNGNVKHCEYWPEDNGGYTMGYYDVLEYDANGNLVKSSCYTSDGSLNNYLLMEYDEAGNKIREEHYPYGTFNAYIVYTYE